MLHPNHLYSIACGLTLLSASFGCGSDEPKSAPPPSGTGGVMGTGGIGGMGGAGTGGIGGMGGAATGGIGGSATGGTAGGVIPGPMMSEAELSRITGTLAADAFNGRDEGSPGGIAARNFIVAEYTACGVAAAGITGFEQSITTGSGVNIIGKVEGVDPALKDRHVLISAHYDHLGACGGAICNGAYDNATAVAIVMGVACTLVQNPPKRTVLIAHWDAEEPPTFLSNEMGSEFYAANPVVPLAQTDVAVVLDLAGSNLWPGYQGHVALGAELSLQVAAAVDAVPVLPGLLPYRAGLHSVEESPLGHQPWSDYDAFRNRNTPVLFLSNGQNKQYHEVWDAMDLIDVPKMAREAEYLLHIVNNLGNANETPVFDAVGADYLVDATSLTAMLEAVVAPGGMLDALSLSSSSRALVESDLAAITAVRDNLAAGGTATQQDIDSIRTGAQRIMCLAGSTYAEGLCAIL